MTPLYTRDDLTPQRVRVEEARTQLGVALAALAASARAQGHACFTRTGRPDLPTLYTTVTAVQRAEEALDLADLGTAAGEDA